MTDPNTLISEISTFITSELLNKPELNLDPQASLIAGGYLDSFRLAKLWIHLEDTYDIQIPNEDLLELVNNQQDHVSGIASFLINKLA